MSRTRKYIKSHARKSGKGRFPRNNKKFNELFLDESGEVGSIKASSKKIYNICNDDSYSDVCADTNRMKRVLRKQAGRPWNDVQSEFLSEFDARTFQGRTVREWLDYIVEQDVILQKDGSVTDARGMRVGYFWEEMYVHPATGTLEISPSQKKKYRRIIPHTVFEMDGTLYHKHEGLWYRVKMKNFTKTKNWWGYGYNYITLVQPDVFVDENEYLCSHRRATSFNYSSKYGLDPKGRGWYCIWKQSANSKEIARLKEKYDIKKAA